MNILLTLDFNPRMHFSSLILILIIINSLQFIIPFNPRSILPLNKLLNSTFLLNTTLTSLNSTLQNPRLKGTRIDLTLLPYLLELLNLQIPLFLPETLSIVNLLLNDSLFKLLGIIRNLRLKRELRNILKSHFLLLSLNVNKFSGLNLNLTKLV